MTITVHSSFRIQKVLGVPVQNVEDMECIHVLLVKAAEEATMILTRMDILH